jgi:1-acyl-sn-glycerol-3-phosphate acyltransferase
MDQVGAVGPRPGVRFYRFCRRVVWAPMKMLTRVRFLDAPDISRREGGLLIAANHQSFLDPLLVGMALEEPICYLARRSLFRTPGFGRLLHALGAHPITRGAVDSRGIRTVLRLLRDGEAVLMFPEGTRTRDGTLGRFRRGVASLATRCNVPVLPVAIEGAYDAWPRTRALPRPARVGVAFGDTIRPEAREADELTDELRDEIARLQEFLRERLKGR